MTFNVWLGGDVVDFGKVVEVIRASGADIVGLQEAEGNTRRIARGARLAVLERPAARRVALSADRPARGARRVRARAGPARARCSRSRTCTSRRIPTARTRSATGRLARARAARSSARPGCPRSARRCARCAPALRARHPDADDRRLQHAVAPRLDARGRRRPRRTSATRSTWPVTRAHWRAPDSRTPTASRIPIRSRRPASRGRSGTRSRAWRRTRSSTGSTSIQASAGIAGARQRHRRPAGHAATSRSRSTPTRPTTARSSSTVRLDAGARRRRSPRSCSGESSAATRSACATPPRAARARTGSRSCPPAPGRTTRS